MKTQIDLPCLKGSAKLMRGPYSTLILTNKRKRPDTLHWHLWDGGRISIYGLYRGRLGDAYCLPSTLYDALLKLGDETTANSLKAACDNNQWSMA